MTTVYGARSSQSQMIKKKIFRALQMLIVIVSLQKHKRLLVLAWHVCEEVSRNLKYKFTIFQYLRSVNV